MNLRYLEDHLDFGLHKLKLAFEFVLAVSMRSPCPFKPSKGTGIPTPAAAAGREHTLPQILRALLKVLTNGKRTPQT